ncbi:GntR family transcriptional regulator [Bordetella trematum]|uniref:GntR family transcriptional regulator n=1 Tax=Bordetella trematum TaxID=123899 RepID=A0A157S8W3_9BORD|nr:GntR family transcriptional regulator [Bordetella trematum]AUL48276.1 GntR family transcriptional regulator [Bordetella trematum]AZR95239.1 GntR family transcriptional regulator [Bordetella trematum]NNH18220.1 GntR family transcriptional regulator [Bordetella trematum]SAI49785.1 GntR family transcriptional regulator [Bordetella trematum]SAI66835.1 GntR family transcriptional regulator [Bordetella trematum]
MADSPLPLYHKVYLLLKQRLQAGGFAPLAALPGENALAAEYGVSRLTIRRSLEALEAEGLIERRQGRGTFAAGQAVLSAPQQSTDIDTLLTHLARMGMQTQVTLLALETLAAPPQVAAQLELPAAAQVQRAVRVRSHQGLPFSYLTTYVPQAIARRITRDDLVGKPLLAIFRDLGVQVARAEQSISAVLAEPQAAAALDVPVGSALLSLHRLVRDADDHPVEWLHALYRPDRYEYRMDMQAHDTPGQPAWLPAGTASP